VQHLPPKDLVFRSLGHKGWQKDPSRGDSERSWTVTREEIEARNYDRKAVNPNAKVDEDLRKPEELLDLIEAKGKEAAEALAKLRVS
jgi:type I restriction enzyme M protein